MKPSLMFISILATFLLGSCSPKTFLLQAHDPKTTLENYHKIQKGMPLDEMKSILGRPDVADGISDFGITKNDPYEYIYNLGSKTITIVVTDGKVTDKWLDPPEKSN